MFNLNIPLKRVMSNVKFIITCTARYTPKSKLYNHDRGLKIAQPESATITNTRNHCKDQGTDIDGSVDSDITQV